MKNAMRTELHANPPANMADADATIDRILASTQYATRCAVHKTFGVSPGAIVFHRDMLLPIPIIADLTNLRERRQSSIDQGALRENRRRRPHEYNVGDQILIIAYKPNARALDPKATGPFTLTQVHTNGTVSFLRNAEVVERINIRRVKPYFSN